MKSQDMLSSLATASQSRLDDATKAQTAAQTEVQSFGDASTQLAADLKASEDSGYDEGFKAAQEKAGTPSTDKQFTLDELNAEIKSAVDPLNAQIADKNVQLESLQSDVTDLQAKVAALQSAASAPASAPSDSSAQAPAPVVDNSALEAAQASLAAVTAERDGLRAAIQVEIDDAKKDTSRLESALPAPAQVPPVESAPVDSSAAATPAV